MPILKKFSPVTQDEVSKVIMKMQTKSCDLDIIPTKVLKELLTHLLPSLTHMVNVSLTEGEFHESWKCALVNPLQKKIGSNTELKNYRPVSNLSFISKLIEKVALNQFLQHCDEYSLLPDYQSAYRKNYSCETCVLSLTNKILWSMENKEYTACALLDLSAAFDTVDWDLLLYILRNRYGVEGEALQWYDSYLRPRSFKVKVNNTTSSEKQLGLSVPQGSASGANIFTAYCGSLGEIIPEDTNLYGFADDHFLSKAYSAIHRMLYNNHITKLASVVEKIHEWMYQMRLKMNTDKTEFIIFGSKYYTDHNTIQSITIGGENVHRVDVVRCLGSHLDQNLNMKEHVKIKSKAAMLNFRRIRSIRTYIDRETCETLVLTLVMSHLDYCNSTLIGVPHKTIHQFQRIQNMCAKLVLSRTKYDSSSECLKELHWLPVKARIHHKLLSILHKSIFAGEPKYLKNLVSLLPEPTRTLRSSSDVKSKLFVPKTTRKTFADRSFSVAAPKLWNILPETLRIQSNYELFKKDLKTHLFHVYLP